MFKGICEAGEREKTRKNTKKKRKTPTLSTCVERGKSNSRMPGKKQSNEQFFLG